MNMPSLTDFFLELDALKAIERKSYISNGTRLENSAEHSWHLAMACWNFAEYFQLNVSMEKLLKLALVHDLGEIDAGDTFLYSDKRVNAHNEERQCVARFAAMPGNGIDSLADIWEEQETGSSEETKILKTVDRLLPFLLNVRNQGRTWKELGVKKSQVLKAHGFIADLFPQVHEWMLQQIAKGVAAGWLIDDEAQNS